MSCDRTRELLGACRDGELSGAARRAVTEHLATCPQCSSEADDLDRVGRQVSALGREVAPPALAAAVRAELARAAQTPPVTAPARPAGRAFDFGWPARRQAAALVAACLATSFLTWIAATGHETRVRFEHDVVSAHIRSLLQDKPIAVASSDSHTVKPWFNGRLEVAPDVKDLAEQGFPLAGGRLDYIADRRVGALVYRRRQHVVNVFVWPAPAGEPSTPQTAVVNGFNIVSWSRNGVAYWAVSDLNAAELHQLQSLL